MWRTAASLELLPIGTKTELGDALVQRVKAGDYKESELWCLSRLGARKLFYGPINLVVPPATATRWVEALLKLPARRRRAGLHGAPHRGSHARPARRHPRSGPRASSRRMPHADRLLAVLEGEEEDDRALGRIFGEELPSGLVFWRRTRRRGAGARTGLTFELRRHFPRINAAAAIKFLAGRADPFTRETFAEIEFHWQALEAR